MELQARSTTRCATSVQNSFAEAASAAVSLDRLLEVEAVLLGATDGR